MRMIDADALIEDIDGDLTDSIAEGRAIEKIMNAPTIEERKKGKWIKGKCSNCGAHAPFWPMATTYYESDFCPNCGSEMQERREDE